MNKAKIVTEIRNRVRISTALVILLLFVTIGMAALPTDWRYSSYYFDKGIFTDSKSITPNMFINVCCIENEYLLTLDSLNPVYYFQLPITVSLSNTTGAPQKYVNVRASIINANDHSSILFDKTIKTGADGIARFDYSLTYSNIVTLQRKDPDGKLFLILFVTTDKTRYVKGFSVFEG